MTQAERTKPENLSIKEKESIYFVESKELDFSLLATTPTMERKKITDATKTISEYFHRTGFHSYKQQEKGPEAKVTKDICFHTLDKSFKSSASLYKATKRGDKRLNLTNFWDYTKGDEVNLLIVHNETLNVINISQINIAEIWKQEEPSNIKNFLNTIFSDVPTIFDDAELEDIEKSDQTAIEGELKERKVLARTRNKAIANERKKYDKYSCKACNFHYQNKVVECHHLNPISMTKVGTVTIDCLVTLCPTCHSIAHQLLKTDYASNVKEKALLKNIKAVLSDMKV